MTEIEITTGSSLLNILAHITERDHAGRHFTQVYSDDDIQALEDAGLITIDRPVHQPTGIPYDMQYWHLQVTQEGQNLVDDRFDERDYADDSL